ncbi:hypothetical protein [Streptomyces sp. NPDC046261]|uniref:hypothetical protein n=1 Tax=Streptomyces sp. NPDC046261 TaxID=3157200 RepID=UPI003407DE2B
MDVAIMGHYRADRLVTALRRHDAERIWLCGPVDVRAGLGPGVRYRYLAADAGVDDVLALWAHVGAQVVVPSLYPLQQEQLLHTLATAAQLVAAGGRRVHVHPPAFAEAVSDKVLFHRLALDRGWPVPEGIVCEDRTELAAALRQLGPPVMVKTGRSVPWEGRWYLDGPDDLGTADGMVFPVVAQRVCRGEEFGVELLTDRGSTLRWPIASFGPLDARCMPGWRTRLMPAALPTTVRHDLDAFVTDVTDLLAPCGAWQIDMAVEAGELRVLEVNGRFGGMAHLSRAVTGIDPYQALATAALGGRPPTPTAVRVAAELPLSLGAHLPADDAVRVEVERPSPTEPCLPSHFHRTLVVADDPAALADWIGGLPAGAWADHVPPAADGRSTPPR